MSAPSHQSWLLLERYHLGELGPDPRAEVRAHLDGCDTCAGRLQSISDDLRPLPALPDPQSTRPWWFPVFFLAPALALALFLVLGQQETDVPADQIAWKGGDLALTLVRDRDGSTQLGADTFVDGDRFAVLLTCPPGGTAIDVAVFQGDETYFPASASRSQCGNRVAIPGAFMVTGQEQITVCVLAGAPPQRSGLSPRTLPRDGVVCTTIMPAKR